LIQALTRLATELPPASRARRTGIPVGGFPFSMQEIQTGAIVEIAPVIGFVRAFAGDLP
jgi:hypothetical protein